MVLLLAAVGCSHNTSFMPTVPRGIPATVTLADRGVDIMAAEENGQPCFALSLAEGSDAGLADPEKCRVAAVSGSREPRPT